jgi:hypothetical protein
MRNGTGPRPTIRATHIEFIRFDSARQVDRFWAERVG